MKIFINYIFVSIFFLSLFAIIYGKGEQINYDELNRLASSTSFKCKPNTPDPAVAECQSVSGRFIYYYKCINFKGYQQWLDYKGVKGEWKEHKFYSQYVCY